MIEQFARLPPSVALSADVCIVGAGAAGISLALALIGAGQSVILLESGSRSADRRIQRLYAGTVADSRLHSAPIRYRARRLGGATTIWGGQCVPFDPIDLATRPYLPNARWPISFEALLAYYPRANDLCEAGEFNYSAADSTPSAPLFAPWSDPQVRIDSLERFSAPTDFGERYFEQLKAAPNVTLLMGANALGLTSNEDRTRILGVQLAGLGGKHGTVSARRVVLAMGGIEVPRFLLACQANRQIDLGAAIDHVGRYYQCHLAGHIGDVQLNIAPKHGYERINDIYCRRRLTIDAAAQREHQIGNFAARLHFPEPSDPAHGSGILSLACLARPLLSYEYGLRLAGAGAHRVLPHLGNVIRDAPATTRFVGRWLVRHVLSRRKLPSVVVEPKNLRFSLDFHAEQAPNRDSRISLGESRDELGMLRPHIDWRYSEADIRTVSKSVELIAAAIQRNGHGTVRFDADRLLADALRYGAYGGHHIGTARMSDGPQSGVVDSNCQVHGIANLFVASAATFASSSQAPPTLTVVALALRLAVHLKAVAV